jgi:hypothetical protein
MYLFCPTCQTQFPAAGRCPRCSNRLLSPGEIVEFSTQTTRAPVKPSATTFGGRVATGCVIALGAHLGLREWSMALLNTVDASVVVVFITGVALRLIAGFLGGLFAGAGREAPFGGGLAVGVAGGFAWLIIDPYPNVSIDLVNLGLTGLICIVSGLAALVGHRIWPPALVLEEPEDSRGSSLLKFMPAGKKTDSRRPTHWWKVLLSSMLVLGAVIGSDFAREGLKKLPVGLLNNFGGSGGAIPRIDFEIAALFIVLGTFVAGLNTGAGLRHGLYAGLLTSIAVVCMYRTQGEGVFPALDFLAEHLESETQSKLALALGSIFFLTGTVGGWMGGQLMPPLRRRKKLGEMA